MRGKILLALCSESCKRTTIHTEEQITPQLEESIDGNEIAYLPQDCKSYIKYAAGIHMLC